MTLPKFSVTRPVFAAVVLIIIFALGVFSLTGVELDLLPELNLPVAVVATSYTGAGPEEVENLVTRPIESAMATISGVDTVSSMSSEGSSLVIMQFNWGTNLESATLEMREAVDMVRGFLPDGTGDPRVLKFDPTMMPVLTLGVSGPHDPTEVQTFVEDVVIPRLERQAGVASVTMDGQREREVQVLFDAGTLRSHGISLLQVGSLLQANNLNLPGGELEEGSRAYTLRVMGEFESIADIEAVQIPTGSGGLIPLGHVAEVVETYKDSSGLARLNGDASLGLSVQKESGANTVTVSRRVNEEIARLQGEAPEGFQFAIVIDQAEFIIRSLQGMITDALLGAALAVGILFLFLRDWRSTLVISIAIPFSAVATFSLIYFSKITLNLLSLGGLALGVGMMVDNAIVVLENIFRMYQEGMSIREAAIEGANEVASAITASTLTTLVVFLPVVFLEGLAAEIFRDLSLTVSFSLAASLLVAITGVPLLASRIFAGPRRGRAAASDSGPEGEMSLGNASETAGGTAAARAGAEDSGGAAGAGAGGGNARGIAPLYGRFLDWSLGRRGWVVAILGIALAGAALLMTVVPTEFLPMVDEGQIFVEAKLPAGTNLDEANRIMTRIEELALDLPEAEHVFVHVGGSAGFGQPGAAGAAVSSGEVQIVLLPRGSRGRSTFAVADEIREKAAAVPGVEVTVTDTTIAGMGDTGGGSGFGGPPVAVEIKGDDLTVLRRLADEVAAAVAAVPGTREVATSFDEGLPELRIAVDRQRVGQLGITPAQVAQTVRAAVAGETVTRMRSGGSEVDVTVRLAADSAATREDIEQLPVATAMGGHVPLMEVARIEEAAGPTSIARSGQARVATVTAKLDGRPLGAVTGDVREQLENLSLPRGYSADLGGEQEIMADAFSNLTTAVVMGFFLMYLIMAAQFESFIFPVSVMLTVPLSLVGVVVGLAATGRTFNVAAFVGLITVMGVIVNNAIVLIDYTGQLRGRGMARREALVRAGTVRLRPILMTALTTILATLPLALGLGEGSEIQAPLATVVGSGLLIGTILTLVVLPVLYSLLDDLFSRWTSPAPAAEAAE